MTTNYYNTLIQIAEDSPTGSSVTPDLTKSSVASQQFALIAENPYIYSSDDVIFARVVEKESIPVDEVTAARQTYFEKGRACLRTSPLAKTHGWGIHANEDGKIALIAAESDTYKQLVADDTVKKVNAMRRSRG